MTLEYLLKMKIECINPSNNKPVKITPDFRIAVQEEGEDFVKIIIHPNGFNGETLDFIVQGNRLKQL